MGDYTSLRRGDADHSNLHDDAVGQMYANRRSRGWEAHRHEGGGRRGQLVENAAAREHRVRGVQRSDRQPMGLGIRLQRLGERPEVQVRERRLEG